MTRQLERTARRRAAVVLLILFLAAVAVNLARADDPRRQRPTVDGHDVDWWANRARANRGLYRAEHHRFLAEQAHRRRVEWALHAATKRARTLQGHGDASTTVAWPWVALADCESGDGDGRPPYGADWGYNGRSGFDGGLQFDPGTWTAYRHLSEPAYAYQASPAVQVAVAERVLAAAGWGAWPVCSRIVGLR